MREWLRETHGVQFELLRHFLRRIFDSEMITSPEQTCSALIGGVSLLLPWFQVLYSPLKSKYAHLSGLPGPGPYRAAVRADQLWLITLMMSIIGLLTAVKWQSLFPDLRDYRVLGALPLRPRQIFLAKLIALLTVAAAALIAVNWLPSFAFPMLSSGHWTFRRGLAARIGAYAVASTAAGAFFFFGLIALQGLLLNLLRPRAFRRLSGRLQGLLVAGMLGLTVLSFSVQPRIADELIQPQWSRWMPPIWFLGLCQSLSGDPDPAMHALARHAIIALVAAVALSLVTYGLCYRRHRTVLLEAADAPAKRGRSDALMNSLFRDPCQQGVIAFIMQTLERSNYHRMILMGYSGLAFAVLMSGLPGMRAFVTGERLAAARFVYFHMIAALFVLTAARHLFSRPTELKANWIFQMTEREARGKWLSAVDRFFLFWAALLWAVPLAFEIRSLGWRGAAEAALSIILGLTAYDWFFNLLEQVALHLCPSARQDARLDTGPPILRCNCSGSCSSGNSRCGALQPSGVRACSMRSHCSLDTRSRASPGRLERTPPHL